MTHRSIFTVTGTEQLYMEEQTHRVYCSLWFYSDPEAAEKQSWFRTVGFVELAYAKGQKVNLIIVI